MRFLNLFLCFVCIVSCNISAKKAIPGIHLAMPKPWLLVPYEEGYLPFQGYPFEPVYITSELELIAFLKWRGIDSGYHEVFNLKNENIIATYRPENKGTTRYSLWLHKKTSTLQIKKEDLTGSGYEGKRTPSYVYFYRIPKTETKFDIMH